MKLTAVFIFVLSLSIYANSYGQSERVNLVMKSSLRDVIEKLEQVSGYHFVLKYDAQILDKEVQANYQNEKIELILDDLLRDTGYTYKIIDRYIAISADSNTFTGQQSTSVSGKVTDSAGAPLPGVSVVVKGTTTGIITDFDGKYTLANVPSDATIQFSFVGMKSLEVSVVGKTTIDVVMEEDAIGIEEVVAVGYGTQKKINLTGSVTSVDGQELAKRPVGQASMALQGMASGVTVTQSSGKPGSDGGTIRIRGIGTLSDSNPLILVDGIESNINNVAPSEIESISVLKDASSAAIYGSRAANGVILVTTKRAKKNKFSLNYSNYLGWQQATELPKMVSGYDHMVMINEANRNVGKSEPFSQSYIDAYLKNAPSDEYPETNWHDVMLKNRAIQQNHSVSINGGGEKISVLASASYLDQDGISINTNYKRSTFRLNSDIQLLKNLSAGFDIYVLEDDDSEPSAGSPWYFLNRYPRNLAGKNSNGTWGIGWDGTNDWATEIDGGMKHSKDYSTNLNLKLNWQPLEGMSFDFQYAPKRNLNHYKSFKKLVSLYYPNGDIYNFSPDKGVLNETYSKSTTETLRGLFNYSKSIKRSNISTLIGYEQIAYRNDWMSGFRDKFPLESYEVLNAGNPINQKAEGNASEWALQSVFGRINYDFSGKYLFEANLRYDGSSRFAKGNKYGVFPSFSAGWRLTEESFMESINWLDNLKLRASWGQLGNQNIGNYPFASVVALGEDYVFNNNIPAQGAAILDSANPNISWETTEMTNIGIDATFVSKLSLSLEYYIKDTYDILLKLPTPMITGTNPPYQNAGKVRNTGWDFSAAFSDKINEFEYRVGLNLSNVKNEIIDLLGTGPYIETRTIKMEGESIYSLYGLEAEGLFQDETEISNHATQFGTVKPGDIKYKDQLTVDSNGDGIFDQGDGKINSNDRVIMGEYMPKYTYGIDVFLKYKNFDFSALIQGVGKVDGYLDSQGVFAFYVGGTAQEWHKDHWTENNRDASYPRLTFNFPNNEQVSSYWKRSAAYMRLKNLQIGYNIPSSLISKTFLSSCRLYFSGQNLLTFDNFYDSFDPEAPIGTGNFYPMVKVMTFGIDVNF